MPCCLQASMSRVPAGAVSCLPSTVKVTSAMLALPHARSKDRLDGVGEHNEGSDKGEKDGRVAGWPVDEEIDGKGTDHGEAHDAHDADGRDGRFGLRGSAQWMETSSCSVMRGVPTRWPAMYSSNSVRNFLTKARVGMAAASPRGQKVRPHHVFGEVLDLVDIFVGTGAGVDAGEGLLDPVGSFAAGDAPATGSRAGRSLMTRRANSTIETESSSTTMPLQSRAWCRPCPSGRSRGLR